MILFKSMKYLFFVVIASIITACGSGNSSSNDDNPSNLTLLGKLPTGQSVMISSPSFSINTGNTTTGTISVAKLTGNESYMLTFSNTQGPSISSTPNPCVVNSSNYTCALTFSANNATNGNYEFTVSYESSGMSSPQDLPNKIPLNITGDSHAVVPGNLSIAINQNSISLGFTTTITLTLSNSQNVTTAVIPNVVATNQNILQESGATECNLTTLNNICTYTFIGKNVGSSTVVASAPGYETATSDNISVVFYAAYISGANNSYTQCLVNAAGEIESDNCTTIAPSDQGALDSPRGLAFNGGFAYFTNQLGNSYTQCIVGATGIESNSCITTSLSQNLDSPSGIAFNGGFAYFTNDGNNTYTQCLVNVSTGIESNSCKTITTSGQGALSGPFMLTFNGGFAYFTDASANAYTQCSVDADTGIESSSCETIAPTAQGALSSPFGLTFNGSFAYFTNFANNSYTQCSVNTDTGINPNSCDTSPSNASAFSGPRAVAFSGGYAYFANFYNIGYTQCMVNTDTGIDPNSCIMIPLPIIEGGSSVIVFN